MLVFIGKLLLRVSVFFFPVFCNTLYWPKLATSSIRVNPFMPAYGSGKRSQDFGDNFVSKSI